MTPYDTELSCAVESNNVEKLTEILNPNVWYITQTYTFPFHSMRCVPLLCYALEQDASDAMIERLIELDSECMFSLPVLSRLVTDTEWSAGHDALHIAVLRGNSYFVQRYLQLGNPKPANMDVLFDYAISKENNIEILEALFEAEWHHDLTQGPAALLLTAMSYDSCNLSVNFDIILEYVPEPNMLDASITDYQGPNRLLHRAVQMGQTRRERLLLVAGADPNILDQHGRVAEWYRSEESEPDMDYVWNVEETADEVPVQPNTILHVPAVLTTAEAAYEWMCKHALNVRDDCDPITMDAWKDLPYETLKTALLIHSHAFLLSSLHGLLRTGQTMNPINRVAFTPAEIRYIRSCV